MDLAVLVWRVASGRLAALRPAGGVRPPSNSEPQRGTRRGKTAVGEEYCVVSRTAHCCAASHHRGTASPMRARPARPAARWRRSKRSRAELPPRWVVRRNRGGLLETRTALLIAPRYGPSATTMTALANAAPDAGRHASGCARRRPGFESLMVRAPQPRHTPGMPPPVAVLRPRVSRRSRELWQRRQHAAPPPPSHTHTHTTTRGGTIRDTDCRVCAHARTNECWPPAGGCAAPYRL